MAVTLAQKKQYSTDAQKMPVMRTSNLHVHAVGVVKATDESLHGVFVDEDHSEIVHLRGRHYRRVRLWGARAQRGTLSDTTTANSDTTAAKSETTAANSETTAANSETTAANSAQNKSKSSPETLTRNAYPKRGVGAKVFGAHVLVRVLCDEARGGRLAAARWGPSVHHWRPHAAQRLRHLMLNRRSSQRKEKKRSSRVSPEEGSGRAGETQRSCVALAARPASLRASSSRSRRSSRSGRTAVWSRPAVAECPTSGWLGGAP